jgi:hypothetical protein
MDLSQKILVLQKKLPKILESLGYEVSLEFQKLIGTNLKFRGTSKEYESSAVDKPYNDSEETWSNNKQQLRLKSGRLYSSFRPNTKTTYVDVKTDKIKIKLGSDVEYANIHEKGGFIKATPITVIRYHEYKRKDGRLSEFTEVKRSYKMAQYFWAKYFETEKQNSFFKIMALAVEKAGGVKIPKRPYFVPALFALRTTGLKKILKKYIQILVREVE